MSRISLLSMIAPPRGRSASASNLEKIKAALTGRLFTSRARISISGREEARAVFQLVSAAANGPATLNALAPWQRPAALYVFNEQAESLARVWVDQLELRERVRVPLAT